MEFNCMLEKDPADFELLNTAYHECGHAVSAVYFGLDVYGLRLNYSGELIDSKGNVAGDVYGICEHGHYFRPSSALHSLKSEFTDDGKPDFAERIKMMRDSMKPPRTHIIREMAVAIAGMVAQAKFCETLYEEVSFQPFELAGGYEFDNPDHQSDTGFCKAMFELLELVEEREQNEAEIWNEAYALAVNAVNDGWHYIDKLATALIHSEGGYLDDVAIYEILSTSAQVRMLCNRVSRKLIAPFKFTSLLKPKIAEAA